MKSDSHQSIIFSLKILVVSIGHNEKLINRMLLLDHSHSCKELRNSILSSWATTKAPWEPKNYIPSTNSNRNKETNNKAPPSTATCYTNLSHWTSAIYDRPRVLLNRSLLMHAKLSTTWHCAKVTNFFRKSEDLQMICSWHVSLHRYHLNKSAGRVYLKQHLLLASRSFLLLWFQLPVCPSSLYSERMMDISAGCLKHGSIS